MQTIVNNMQPGWNMGDTLDAKGSETSWGNPRITKEQIEAIAASGFKSLHIPITWRHRMGDAPDYAVNDAFMARVREVIDWALDAGLYVVIDLHHDSDWIYNMESNYDETLARFTALWRQIAEAFSDYPPTLMFESINEPRFSENWEKDTPEYFQMVDTLNTAFYNTVRDTGSGNTERPLVLVSVVHGISQPRLDALYETISRINDPHVIAGVHYYGFYPFSVNLGGVTTFDAQTRGHMEDALNRCASTFVERGIPVIVGEYGLLAFDEALNGVQRGEMLKYFEYLTYYASRKNLTMVLWDNGQHSDRRNLVWRDEIFFQTLMHGLTSGKRSSTAAHDFIFLKKQQLIVDAHMPLNLNGNEFTGLYKGDTPLHQPNDYVYDDGILTIKPDFLLKLPSSPTGVTAALRCTFSSGPDWTINVIQYDTPVLKPAYATGMELVIPTDFNGDIVETMEAMYIRNGIASGGAGPEDWTTYKQYNVGFVPSVEDSVITIPSRFFEQTQTGEILLRFYFLSGHLAEYRVQKNEVSLVGVPLEDKGQAASSAKAQKQTVLPAGNSDKPSAADEAEKEKLADKIKRAWNVPAVKVATGSAGVLVLAVAAKVVSQLLNNKKRK